jgi:hypothetical protein
LARSELPTTLAGTQCCPDAALFIRQHCQGIRHSELIAQINQMNSFGHRVPRPRVPHYEASSNFEPCR